MFNRREGMTRGGASLSPGRSRYLLARAKEGPWTERVTEPEPDEPRDTFWNAGLDIAAVAPIYAGPDIAGILTLGTSFDGTYLHQPARRAGLMASVIDYASILSVVAGPAILDRQHAAASKARLRHILAGRAFRPVFQPIVDLETRSPVGFEILTRFADGVPPDIRFEEATAAGLGEQFELAAIEVALSLARRLPEGAWISVNVSPDVVIGAGRRLRRTLDATERHVILEVTEHAQIDDYEAFRGAIARLGDVSLAVDDAGAGYASLRHILELEPTFAKLDRALVLGIDRDPLKQALAAGLEYFALRTGCTLIAEGVETEADAATLVALGVEYAQGYLFGRPSPADAIGTNG
jgi:EAL domain-containing protein (putative c-di-GMP-specific phosphodiesterase class I)